MILPIILADTLDKLIKDSSEKYCLNCLSKVEKDQDECDQCDSSSIGLMFHDHSAARVSDLYYVILDLAAPCITPVGKNTMSLQEELDSGSETFVYKGMVYRTEDVIELLNTREIKSAA